MALKNLLATGAVLVAMTSTASAATFDFDALADVEYTANGNVEVSFDQAQPGGWTVDGITVNATGSRTDGGAAHAFLDSDFSNSNGAGLGVCSSGFLMNGNSNCATNGGGNAQGDDNVTGNEILDLAFSTTVSLVDMLFRAGNHTLANGSILAASSNAALAEYTLNDGKLSAADLATLGGSTMFRLQFDDANFGNGATQFYVSSVEVAPVPVPASLGFLLAGLGGLGLAKRRRKTA